MNLGNTGHPRRLKFRRLVAIDVTAAVLLIAVIGEQVLVAGQHGQTQAQVRPAAALAGAAALAVAARRRWPLAALAVSVAAQAAATIAGWPFSMSMMLSVTLVTYLVARVKQARTALLAPLCAVAACGAASFLAKSDGPVYLGVGSAPSTLVRAATEAAFIGAAWAIGRAMRARAAYKDRYARATIQEERLRIARELHDVVTHSMSVIAVQAGVGHFVIGSRPEEAEKALAAIETTSRESLTEMRRLLGMLREERPGDLLPAPGLADVSELVDQTRRGGLDVDMTVDGEPLDLPAGADLAAFRVIQEALTNVLKHAGTRRCRVALGYAASGVTIEVTDEGRGPYRGTEGHGLAGMRERIAMYGGTIKAGPRRPGPGFAVEAWLPL